ncbi:MAG: lipase family protein [Planctomycetota bacterium]
MLKRLPEDLRGLRVPNPTWPYFEGAGLRPFEAEAPGFRLANAWWLAEASFLAYLDDPEAIRASLARVGRTEVRIFESERLRAVLARGAGPAWLIFRGTLISSRRNLVTDLRVRLVSHRGAGRVHRGFAEAFDHLRPALEAASSGADPIFVTGHSLGAALATLAADELGPRARLYGFGSPRVGDADFAAGFRCPRAYRVVVEHDLVAELPPPLLYRHVGELHRILGDGRHLVGSAAELDLKERFERNLRERLPGIVRRATDAASLGGEALRENAITDHAPVSYAVRLWNALERR